MPRDSLARCSRVLIRGLTLLTAIYLIAPLLVIVPLSFTADDLLVYPVSGPSLRWYRELLRDPAWVQATLNSLYVGTLTMLAATSTGTLCALGLNRIGGRLARLLIALLSAPLVVPVVIIAVALFYHLSHIGMAGTYTGLIAAHTVLATPLVVITVLATLRGLSPDLSRAGASLGASPPRVFFRITLPLISPGVVAGALLAFATSFEELVVALFVAGPAQRTLPRQIFSGMNEGTTPAVAAAAVLLVAISLLTMGVVAWLSRRNRRLGATASPIDLTTR